MIRKASTSRYLLGDFINFIKNLVTIASTDAVAKQNVKTFTDALQAKYLEIDAANAYQKDAP